MDRVWFVQKALYKSLGEYNTIFPKCKAPHNMIYKDAVQTQRLMESDSVARRVGQDQRVQVTDQHPTKILHGHTNPQKSYLMMYLEQWTASTHETQS